MREPANRDNPKAAAVAKDRAVLGYLPKEHAPTWNQFIEGKNRDGPRLGVPVPRGLGPPLADFCITPLGNHGHHA
jgi:hypothetical protein